MEGPTKVENHDDLLSKKLPLTPQKSAGDDFGSGSGLKKGQDTVEGGDMPKSMGFKRLDGLLNPPTTVKNKGGGRKRSKRRSRRRKSKRRRYKRRKSTKRKRSTKKRKSTKRR
jgi:hypothetical protein